MVFLWLQILQYVELLVMGKTMGAEIFSVATLSKEQCNKTCMYFQLLTATIHFIVTYFLFSPQFTPAYNQRCHPVLQPYYILLLLFLFSSSPPSPLLLHDVVLCQLLLLFFFLSYSSIFNSQINFAVSLLLID